MSVASRYCNLFFCFCVYVCPFAVSSVCLCVWLLACVCVYVCVFVGVCVYVFVGVSLFVSSVFV